jgi:type I restriction enzyme R subunit
MNLNHIDSTAIAIVVLAKYELVAERGHKVSNNEARARIKINKLLEASGWRFEDTTEGKANIALESGVKFADLGDDLENAVSRSGTRGAIDFLLLDQDKKPLVVVEAKRESIDPLSAKEQARNYARNIGARFIILSNGNIHFFGIQNMETLKQFQDFQRLHP